MREIVASVRTFPASLRYSSSPGSSFSPYLASSWKVAAIAVILASSLATSSAWSRRSSNRRVRPSRAATSSSCRSDGSRRSFRISFIIKRALSLIRDLPLKTGNVLLF